ncbi:sigma factor-like helix-turn-helix DNA-binding protein [Listeria booriae]|uniref:sigma factor-like helix-turn-helix DNA-binding protein n=1 Tax=Listeria booriae TaxID=1552123 RepID=UPI00162AB5B1|nr:hypothetical protein [Listeria booriae]
MVVTGELIVEALKNLPEDNRNIVLLYYFFCMTDREIAEKLDLVRRTVSRRQNIHFLN